MPLILSIETAERGTSVALHKAGTLIKRVRCDLHHHHSRSLIAMIRELTTVSQVPLSKLSAIAVSSGPGSYTGLRIGVATAKGIAYGCAIPLISISTLYLIARHGLYATTYTMPVHALMDAGKQKAYRMIVDPKSRKMTAVDICDLTTFRGEPNQAICLVGSGATHYAAMIKDRKSIKLIEDYHLDAKDMGELGYTAWEEKRFVDMATFEPLYISAFANTKHKSTLSSMD